jgi:hypothetical protein
VVVVEVWLVQRWRNNEQRRGQEQEHRRLMTAAVAIAYKPALLYHSHYRGMFGGVQGLPLIITSLFGVVLVVVLVVVVVA